MRILPVLDLKQGVVVRGVGGRRDEYQPVKSRLTDSAQPLDVALAFRHHFGLNELYMADLDSIGGKSPDFRIYRELVRHGFDLWVDAGIHQSHLHMLDHVGVQSLVAGLESLPGPGALGALLRDFSPERIVFSLDLKDGKPLGVLAGWDTTEPDRIARQAVDLGIARILVLDLAGVGGGAGTRTNELCRRLRRDFRNLELTTGGGVRGVEDLRELNAIEVDGVLVASALHDGLLSKDDIAEFDETARDSHH